MPDHVPSALHMLTDETRTTPCWGRCYYFPRFIHGESGLQRGEGADVRRRMGSKMGIDANGGVKAKYPDTQRAELQICLPYAHPPSPNQGCKSAFSTGGRGSQEKTRDAGDAHFSLFLFFSLPCANPTHPPAPAPPFFCPFPVSAPNL